jgi:chromosome partitioning protein
MAFLVAIVSQKGGVGKSTLARLLAREFAAQGWNVKIADLDISQGTSFQWRSRRLENQIGPDVPVEQFGQVDRALALAGQYEMLIFDGAPPQHERDPGGRTSESLNCHSDRPLFGPTCRPRCF